MSNITTIIGLGVNMATKIINKERRVKESEKMKMSGGM
jgi:hypothetical protein